MLIWLCQLSGRYMVMFEFYLNQEYIVKNLCVNRDKPQMHCNGKCHLRKQLNAEDKKDQDNPERRAENKSEIFYADTHFINIVPSFRTITITHHTPLSIGTPTDAAAVIFHPPTV